MVGKDHRSAPAATHKEDNQKINHALTSSHNGSPYVHATGITNLNTSISLTTQFTTSMTLISPSQCLKTIARNQTSHIFNALYESFYYIYPPWMPIILELNSQPKKITMLFRDSQNNISEAL